MSQQGTVIQPGTVLNDTYLVQKQIGSGGGGSIYLGYHTRLEKHVAIKKIHEAGMVPEEILKRESNILKELRHTYLPTVFDFLVNEMGVFTVMDYIPGWSLKELLDSGHKFSEKEIVKYGTQICEAVKYLHENKLSIVHGDIKPANIMITPEGNIVLIDFNISGFANADGKAYTFGYSPGYAAPEQYNEYQRLYGNPEMRNTPEAARGIAIDFRTDIYSIGATLYHMLTGMKITKAPKGEVLTNASDGLVYILNKALNENPGKRYATADQMLNAFQNIYKLDKRYKALEVRSTVLQIVFILLAAVGVLLIYIGINTNRGANSSQYDNLIVSMQEARADGDLDEFEKYYEDALELNNTRVDAYSERVDMLFDLQDYEGDIDYIEDVVLDVEGISYSNDIGYIYYMLGLCYFESEDYTNAINAYKNALKYDSSDGNIYVQYAISLARVDDIQKAEEALEEAKDKGASNSLVYLTDGEIKLAMGKYDEAIDNFDSCIDTANNEYVLMRAYIMKSSSYSKKAANTADASEAVNLYREAAKVLEDAKKALPSAYRTMILQRQAQVYIDAYQISDDSADAHAAIASLQEIADTGLADFNVYNNIIIMYQNCGELDEAQEVLESIESKFANRYEYYMRRAFQEILLQNQVDPKDANYDKFKEYYDLAKELYEGKTPNVEMGQLESLYNDLADAGVF